METIGTLGEVPGGAWAGEYSNADLAEIAVGEGVGAMREKNAHVPVGRPEWRRCVYWPDVPERRES